MNRKNLILKAILAGAIPALAPSSFSAGLEYYALEQSGDHLLSFAPNGSLQNSVPITGLAAGDSLVDIDFFTSGDKQLYGLGKGGTLYTLNRATGAATVNVAAAAVGNPTVIDFNPAADRLRIFSGDSNYRLTPNTGVVSSDGSLAYAVGDANEGENPFLTGAAYINNFDAPPGTALYSIDSDLNTVVLHSGAPQFSTLNTLASLSLGGSPYDISGHVGFDILSVMPGQNRVFLSDNRDVYQLNLASGAMTALTTFQTGEEIRSIAVVNTPDAGGMLPMLSVAVAGLLCTHARVRQRQ